MNVGVCYAEADRQTWVKLEVPDDATVQQAIELSGMLKQYPHINLDIQKVGIFGKLTKLNSPIKEGDRIEIYRQITADPAKVKRRRIEVDDDDDDDDD
ncbi:RnfH family protein [Methylomonas rhizoryzae]|nr:RnfH family protein [Methylomonas rhizoryzae]